MPIIKSFTSHLWTCSSPKKRSFTRRLKRWSFHRISRGAELGAYYNENFLKDYPAKVSEMKYHVVNGDVVGAAAATMASGGTTHAAAAAALAAAAMVQGNAKKGKRGKRKVDDMNDGMLTSMGGMVDPRNFPMQQWNNMMQQQYLQMMMAQQFAAQQGVFGNNFMNGPNSFRNNGNDQDSEDANGQDSSDMNGAPQRYQGNQFQGNMPFFPFPMMGMPFNMPNMPPNMQAMMFQNSMQNMSNNMMQNMPNNMMQNSHQQVNPNSMGEYPQHMTSPVPLQQQANSVNSTPMRPVKDDPDAAPQQQQANAKNSTPMRPMNENPDGADQKTDA